MQKAVKNFLKRLNKDFYERDTAIVAKELLGKVLVRRLGEKTLAGIIVETEAYYDENDPASRAYLGRPKYCVELMKGDVGKSLVYMVHGNWLFNVVAHAKNKTGAVLIRAIEPINGIKTKTNGPGKLTKAMKITKELNGISLIDGNDIFICSFNNKNSFEICSSYRIGVKRDLPIKLRFFIKGNKFVSK